MELTLSYLVEGETVEMRIHKRKKWNITWHHTSSETSESFLSDAGFSENYITLYLADPTREQCTCAFSGSQEIVCNWQFSRRCHWASCYRRGVLRVDKSSGFGDLGVPQWDLTLSLLLVYVILYFATWKGVKTSGKVRVSIFRVRRQSRYFHICRNIFVA